MEDYVHRAGRNWKGREQRNLVTFITEEQDRYSVDLYRALTASNANVLKTWKILRMVRRPGFSASGRVLT